MHELSVADSLLKTVLLSLEGRKFVKVKEVRVDIGELALIGREQLVGAFEMLAEGTLASGAMLTLTQTPGRVECASCGYVGQPKRLGDPGFQHSPLVFACPKCSGLVRIAGGDDITVKDVVLEVED